MSKKKSSTPSIDNRRARFDYQILETFEAGISLVGTEVKSLRGGQGNLQDAYVNITDQNEAELLNFMIPHYSHGNIYNHEETRKRKLLLHKKEIEKLRKETRESGMTIVPLKVYFNAKGIVKVLIGIAKGKQTIDKRQSIKEREDKRSVERAMKI